MTVFIRVALESSINGNGHIRVLVKNPCKRAPFGFGGFFNHALIQLRSTFAMRSATSIGSEGLSDKPGANSLAQVSMSITKKSAIAE
jgi:hypothetical protein